MQNAQKAWHSSSDERSKCRCQYEVSITNVKISGFITTVVAHKRFLSLKVYFSFSINS